jgi:hypothetical protein
VRKSFSYFRCSGSKHVAIQQSRAFGSEDTVVSLPQPHGVRFSKFCDPRLQDGPHEHLQSMTYMTISERCNE